MFVFLSLCLTFPPLIAANATISTVQKLNQHVVSVGEISISPQNCKTKSKTTAAQREEINSWVKIAVTAAEHNSGRTLGDLGRNIIRFHKLSLKLRNLPLRINTRQFDNYLDKPLTDGNGLYNYKLVDGKIVERTETDKAVVRPG